MGQQAAAGATYTEHVDADKISVLDETGSSPSADGRSGANRPTSTSVAASELSPDHPFLPGYYLG
jgi:hypothetical protein